MRMMCEEGKCGGMSAIPHRYGKANNHYLPDFDPSEEECYLMQIDMNNLYGFPLISYLPVDSFKWADEKLSIQDILDINEHSENTIGFFVKVDLECPQHLHDEHNDYPLAPEHMVINKTKKLVANLQNKTKYVFQSSCRHKAP